MQLTAFLSSLTKSANILNDVSLLIHPLIFPFEPLSLKLVDKHVVLTAARDDKGPRRRGMGRQGTLPGDWGDRLH